MDLLLHGTKYTVIHRACHYSYYYYCLSIKVSFQCYIHNAGNVGA